MAEVSAYAVPLRVFFGGGFLGRLLDGAAGKGASHDGGDDHQRIDVGGQGHQHGGIARGPGNGRDVAVADGHEADVAEVEKILQAHAAGIGAPEGTGLEALQQQEEEKDPKAEEEKVKLFQKETYVYDIGGGKFKTEREKMLEKVEKDEDAEEQAESERKEYIAGLDAQWKETEQEVRKRLEKLLPLLDKQDAKALQKAALENKLPLLYMIG